MDSDFPPLPWPSLSPRPSETSRPPVERPERKLRRTKIQLAVVLALIASFAIGTTQSVTAANGDGQVQPGDRFGSSYCTVGPAFGTYVFTPKHCGWLAGLGDVGTSNVAVSGVELNTAESADWRLSNTASSPQTITTWLDCPSIRESNADPVVAEGCRQNGADIGFVGVIQPWMGLPVTKSGPTTGLTSGTVGSDPINPPNDWSHDAAYINDMYVCRGDSGSPVFAEVDGQNYLIGMITAGSGSVAVDQSTSDAKSNAKACYRTPADFNVGVVVTIEHLCRQLPAPDRENCLTQAGSPRGTFHLSRLGPAEISVNGVGFDPDTASKGPLQRVSVTINGEEVPVQPTFNPEARRFHLYPPETWGVNATTGQLPDGRHEICLTYHNDADTPGIDDRHCQTIAVCQGTLADNIVIGSPDGDVLTGSNGIDWIEGLEGDDAIDGGAGNDCLFGGPGNDALKGGAGRNVIDGGPGSDLVDGAPDEQAAASPPPPAATTPDTGHANGGADAAQAVQPPTPATAAPPPTTNAAKPPASEDSTTATTVAPERAANAQSQSGAKPAGPTTTGRRANQATTSTAPAARERTPDNRAPGGGAPPSPSTSLAAKNTADQDTADEDTDGSSGGLVAATRDIACVVDRLTKSIEALTDPPATPPRPAVIRLLIQSLTDTGCGSI